MLLHVPLPFSRIAKPQTESELAVMVSVLEAHGISHFVHNRGFGGLYPGMQMDLYNERRLMVAESHIEEAVELLSMLSQPSADATIDDQLTIWDRLRVAAEILLFSWAFPHKRQRAHRGIDENNQHDA
jgi:hypothetical protein